MDTREKYNGIGWMSFYIRIRFPIAFIFGIIGIIMNISSISSSNQYIPTDICNAYIGLVALQIFVYIFRIPTYKEMQKLTEKGYERNIILLILESALLAFNEALKQSITSYGSLSGLGYQLTIAAIVVCLIWFLPNFLYFKHRKFRFDGVNTIDALVAERNSDPENKDNGINPVGQIPAEVNCSDSSTETDNGETPVPANKALPEIATEAETIDADIKFCRKCGNKLIPGSKFCNKCGFKIS